MYILIKPNKLKNIRLLLTILLTFSFAFTSVRSEAYAASVSEKAINWGYTKSVDHKAPAVSKATKELLKKYDGYYVYNAKKEYIYLTFDLGYDNGYTNQILDVLEEHDIKATFFVCKAAITANPKAIKRMVKEGHIVANHTVNHIPFYKLSKSSLKKELKEVEEAYEKVTEEKMAKFVRPPEGGYSEKALAITKELGYTTVLWSIALPNDWNLKNQPSQKTALALFKNQHHKGAIVLLHAVSPTVADNLDAMLTQLEKEGYEFRLVSDMTAEE